MLHSGLQLRWAGAGLSYDLSGEARLAGLAGLRSQSRQGESPWRGATRPRRGTWHSDSFLALTALTLLRASWRRTDLGREAWEVEGWPCSRSARKRSGHPRVTTESLRQLVQDIGMGPRLGLLPQQKET